MTVPSRVVLASLDLAVYMNVSVTTELPATLLMDVADVNLDGEELGMHKIENTDRSYFKNKQPSFLPIKHK